jgi:hypothetical protein
MRQLSLFPEIPVASRPRLTEVECLQLIERTLPLGRLAQVKWFLDECWKRAIP